MAKVEGKKRGRKPRTSPKTLNLESIRASLEEDVPEELLQTGVTRAEEVVMEEPTKAKPEPIIGVTTIPDDAPTKCIALIRAPQLLIGPYHLSLNPGAPITLPRKLALNLQSSGAVQIKEN